MPRLPSSGALNGFHQAGLDHRKDGAAIGW